MTKDDFAQLLPEIFRMTVSSARDNPLDTILALMAAMQSPSEAIIDDLHIFFDPLTAPPRFLPYLAGWVDMDALWIDYPHDIDADNPPPFPAGEGRLRELLHAAAYLSRWRGTAQGLQRFLTVATGIEGYTIEENPREANGQPRPFHIQVTAPSAAAPYHDLIQRIIRTEKPAHVTHTLVIAEPEPTDDTDDTAPDDITTDTNSD